MPTLNFTPSVMPSETAAGGFQNVRATPSAFGADQGAALQQLGQQFEQAGSRLADVTIARQNIFNQVAVDEQARNWKTEADKLFYGDPEKGDTGFNGLKGSAAMSAYPEVYKKVGQLLQEHTDRLQNPVQKHLFAQTTRREYSILLNEMGRKYDRENNVWTESVYKGQEALGKQEMARAAAVNDQDEFDAAVAKQIGAATKRGVFLGLSPEETQAKIGEITATAVEVKATALMADDPVGAMRFLEANKEHLKDPAKFLALKGRVEAKARDTEAEDIARNRPSRASGLVRGGAVATRMEEVFRKRGWSDAAIAGAINNSITESSLNPNATGSAGEKGYFQFHPASHLPAFKQKYGNDFSPEAHANYVADVVEKEMPDYKLVKDSRNATAQFLRGFERPQDQSDAEVARRFANNYIPRNNNNLTMTEGDSIGVGFKNVGLRGNPVGGRNPQAVLDNINMNLANNPDYYRGQTVLLSGGTMNDPDGTQTELIRDQIDKIQKAGGKVILAGADTGKFALRNTQLEQIARAAGVPFAGPLPTKDVHPGPQEYKDYAENAKGLIQNKQDQLVSPPLEAGEFPDDQIPGLAGEIQRIMKDPRAQRDPKVGELAIKKVRAEMNALYANQQHARTMQNQIQQDTDRKISNEYISRMTSTSTNYPTPDEIKADTRISAVAKENLVGFVLRDAKPATDVRVSAANQRGLFARMQPDYEGEDKILSPQQIDQEYIAERLTRSDRDELKKDLADIQDPTGPRFRRKIAEVLKRVEVQILPQLASGMPKAQLYTAFPEAAAKVGEWEAAVKGKIQEYQEAKKNPMDLFIPGKPDYVGGEDFMKPFVGTLGQKMQDAKPAAPAKLDLSTAKGIKDAYDAGHLTREQATQELVKRGFARPAPEAPFAR